MRLVLPLPPSFNEMIDLAKQRDRKGRPTIYSVSKDQYGLMCDVRSRTDGIFPPKEPWEKWVIEEASFYLWNFRDPVELMSGLKWPVDWLVKQGFVKNDSHRELQDMCFPYQEIDRKDPRLEMEILKFG